MSTTTSPRVQTTVRDDPASSPPDLAASYAGCREVARRRARNFYYGMKLTPQPKRSALYAVYAWMRVADDLADAEGTPQQKVARLEEFREATLRAVAPQGGPGAVCAGVHAAIWPAVTHVFREHRIPTSYLTAMIDGQLLDQQKSRYATFEELHDYCYQVASVVGLTCLEIWGYDGSEAARRMAADRGVALQLTNILRDLVEDARRDRVYIPADELARAGLDAESFRREVLAGQAGAPFLEVMRVQIERARGYFSRAAALEEHIDARCRPTCWAIMRIYQGLLEKIAARPRRVLTQRVRLSSFTKAGIALRAAWRRRAR